MKNRKLVHPFRFAFILFFLSGVICISISLGSSNLSRETVNISAFTKVEASNISQGHIYIEKPEIKDEANITEEEWMEAFYIDCINNNVDPAEALAKLSLGDIKNKYTGSEKK